MIGLFDRTLAFVFKGFTCSTTFERLPQSPLAEKKFMATLHYVDSEWPDEIWRPIVTNQRLLGVSASSQDRQYDCYGSGEHFACTHWSSGREFRFSTWKMVAFRRAAIRISSSIRKKLLNRWLICWCVSTWYYEVDVLLVQLDSLEKLCRRNKNLNRICS